MNSINRHSGCHVVLTLGGESTIGNSTLVYHWSGYEEEGNSRSLLNYIDQHAERLRRKYLAYIHDLGESRINHRRIVDHLTIDGEDSYWWMTLLAEKSIYKSSCIVDALRFFALAEIFQDEKPLQVELCGRYDSRLLQTLGDLCQQLGIPFKKERGVAIERFLRIPHLVRGILAVRHLGYRWKLRSSRSVEWNSGEHSALVVSYFAHLDAAALSEGRFHSHQWESLPELLLGNDLSVNWIHHYRYSGNSMQPEEALGRLEDFNAHKKNQPEKHAFLDSYISLAVIIRAVRHWGTMVWASIKLRDVWRSFQSKEASVNLWPLLKDDWMNSLRGSVAFQNALWVALFDKAMRTLPHQPIGFYLFEGQGWESAFVAAWKRYGHGKLIAVVHSTIRFWDLRYFHDQRTILDRQSLALPKPDKIAVNGPVAMGGYHDANYPDDYLVEVEAIRYTGLLPLIEQQDTGPFQHGGELQVLVLGEYGAPANRPLMQLLVELPKQIRSAIGFVVKSHPETPILNSEYPELDFELENRALIEIMQEYDVVYCGSATSASVDAYIAGRHVIVQKDAESLNFSPLRGVPGVYFVADSNALISAFRGVEEERTQPRQPCFWLDKGLPRWQRLLQQIEQKH